MDRRIVDCRAVAAVTALLMAMIPATVAGAPPIREPFAATSIGCDEPLTAGDDVLALYIAQVHETFGPFAEFEIWANGADTAGPPTHVASFEEGATGSASAAGMTIMVPITTFEGDPAGTGTIEASFEPDGRAVRLRDVFRFGNTFERVTGTVQPLDITSGTLTALGETYDLSACSAASSDLRLMRSAPDAFVNRSSGFDVNCFWGTEEAFRGLFASQFEGDSGFVDVFFEDLQIFGTTEADVSPAGLSAEIPLFDPNGEELPFTASIDATFSEGTTQVEILQFEGGFAKAVITPYDVAGSLVVEELGIELDLTDCSAAEFVNHEVITSPSGPKGKPLPNDTPEGAIATERGDAIRVVTAGTELLPEVDPTCVIDPEFGTEFGKSVWYSIEGDGDVVTVDTAGSDFDTVIAVYEVDGDSLTEIACVDDVPVGDVTRTLQAAATFETEEGVTYLIQVGGWAFQSGRLVVSVS